MLYKRLTQRQNNEMIPLTCSRISLAIYGGDADKKRHHQPHRRIVHALLDDCELYGTTGDGGSEWEIWSSCDISLKDK